MKYTKPGNSNLKVPADISAATKRNFKKLNKNLETHAFTSRANKRDSTKTIIPQEYYLNKKNINLVSEITEKIKSFDKAKAFNSLVLSYLLDKELISLNQKNQIYSKYPFVEVFSKNLTYEKSLLSLKIPSDEQDPLGLIYQQFLTEGEKNIKGSYYTPKSIVSDLMKLEKNTDKTFCDPCCGTGVFLLEAENYFSPENIYGFDLDPIAVTIAKANLFIKHPEIDYNKKIRCENFLLKPAEEYDFFITNPPWGSLTDDQSKPLQTCVKSNESFSYFLEAALKSISKYGIINFLLPLSVLNVKVHCDIRQFILNNYQIQQINTYGKCFKGVLTDVISLKIGKKKKSDYSYKIKTSRGQPFECSVKYAFHSKTQIIPLLDKIDASIIEKIEKKAQLNLENAAFALGIVTGNNEILLKKEPAENLKPILTGKEIKKYLCQEPVNFIEYNRKIFQQVCPHKFFQAESKFLYKFISRKLVFALDEKQNLALNSANLMILPENFELNKYVVLALLNSDFMNFYFIKIFNQIKILKEHIKNLPLPNFDEKQQSFITNLVQDILTSKNNSSDDFSDSTVSLFFQIENYLNQFFEFSPEEIERINLTVSGRFR